MKDSVTHQLKGFGVITFDLEYSAEDVMMNNFYDFNGKQVEVERIVPKYDNRDNGKRSPLESFLHYGTLAPISFQPLLSVLFFGTTIMDYISRHQIPIIGTL